MQSSRGSGQCHVLNKQPRVSSPATSSSTSDSESSSTDDDEDDADDDDDDDVPLSSIINQTRNSSCESTVASVIALSHHSQPH